MHHHIKKIEVYKNLTTVYTEKCKYNIEFKLNLYTTHLKQNINYIHFLNPYQWF